MTGHDPARRGAVLLEVLVSLALFVGAAGFTLGAVQNVMGALERAGREALALDLTRSLLAQLEAGAVTVAELRETAGDSGGLAGIGSVEMFEERDDVVWVVDIESSRSEHGTLSLVEITVTGTRPGAAAPGFALDDDNDAVRCTLRQLMRLREGEADTYEQDEMLEGLPTEPAP